MGHGWIVRTVLEFLGVEHISISFRHSVHIPTFVSNEQRMLKLASIFAQDAARCVLMDLRSEMKDRIHLSPTSMLEQTGYLQAMNRGLGVPVPFVLFQHRSLPGVLAVYAPQAHRNTEHTRQ